VLEDVGDAGAEVATLGEAAGFAPSLDGDDGGAVIFLDDQAEAVGEFENLGGAGGEIDAGGSGCRGGCGFGFEVTGVHEKQGGKEEEEGDAGHEEF
jgi:hypothetical protein